MAKQKTQFQWGARSAIQKAIRRSDYGMLRCAIDTLWECDPSWLLWRMPVLAAEGVPQLTGEVANAAAVARFLRKETGNDAAALQVVKSALEKLCYFKKDLSTWSMYNFCTKMDPPKSLTDSEVKRLNACKMAYKLFKENKAATFWKAAFDRSNVINNTAIDVLVRSAFNRFSSGGMEGDRFLMMVTTIFAVGEYYQRDFLNEMQDTPIEAEPFTQEQWPWYVFDMHTLIGKQTLAKTAKELGLSQNYIAERWFHFESNKLARGGLDVGPWYKEFFAQFQKKTNYTPEKWANSELRACLKENVTYFLNQDAG